MTVLALTGLSREAQMVRALGASSPAMRRVTEVAELLAAADPALTDGVAIAARFPQMTREVAQHIARSGVPVIAVVDVEDDVGRAIAQDWGIVVVPVGSDPAGSVTAALAGAGSDTADVDPARPSPDGALIVVTGAAGAPGRTTVALHLAAAWGEPSLLIDADPVAPSVGPVLGITGATDVRGACRRAAQGSLACADLLHAAAPGPVPGMRVLAAGPTPEVSATGARALLQLSREITTIVDAGPAPRYSDAQGLGQRIGVTMLAETAWNSADVVLCVAQPTALGIRRWLELVPQLSRSTRVVVVWNGVSGPTGRLAQLTRAALPHAVLVTLPLDSRAASALATGTGTLLQLAPRSALWRALQHLAQTMRNVCAAESPCPPTSPELSPART